MAVGNDMAMKAIVIAVLGALLLAGGGDTAGAQGTRRSNPVLNGIELTDAQKVKLEEIQKTYRPQMQAIREAAQNGEQAETMKKLAAIREKQYAEFRTVLTPAQQAVFDKRLEEMKARREQRQAPSSR